METEQTRIWTGEFGRSYTTRNTFRDVDDFNQKHVERFGVARDSVYADWLSGFSRDSRILEVGCNLCYQIASVGRAGIRGLFGIDIQDQCLRDARRVYPEVTVTQASAFEIPFADGTFDVVMTHHVLIHISTKNLAKVLGEINRVSKSHILGIEYYAPRTRGIPYRGNEDLMWKGNYPDIFAANFPGLSVEREEKCLYLDGSGNQDIMYLLSKGRV